jgi:CRISPR-associated protein Csd2
MPTLTRKIDFAIIYAVERANPNGDPLNGNRPRQDFAGYGEMSDVSQKRKVRDRLMDRFESLPDDQRVGQAIFVQPDERRLDEAKNLRQRAEKVLTAEIMKDRKRATDAACAAWLDVRAFGQVFPFKGKKGGKGKNKDDVASEADSDGVSIPVRGPVTIQAAFSISKIETSSSQIVKSTSLEGDGTKRESDQMGMKHRVEHAVYVTYGSMNPQLAERTGFSDEDAAAIKAVLPRLFVNDESAARPAGSMRVKHVLWWAHRPGKVGQAGSGQVHDALRVHLNTDGTFDEEKVRSLLPDVDLEILEGQ